MLKEEEELTLSPVMSIIGLNQADLDVYLQNHSIHDVIGPSVNGITEHYEEQENSYHAEFLQQEETITMDMAVKCEDIQMPLQVQPVWRRGVPDRRVFPGNLDFQVEINAGDTHKRKYLYSNRLNRIYVDMKTNFPVHFRWNHTVSPRPMYIRATVVFSDESQAEKKVERCTQHTHDPNNKDLAQNVIKNVLHSIRDFSLHGVYYCGDTTQADCWYSVLVELPVNSTPPYVHAYQFVCKNSCPNGINRRAIDIIFELEDSSGYIHGRQMVGARVCACPRRDMLRDEETEGVLKGNKRALPPAPNSNTNTKKVKLVSDHNVYKLPSLEIVGIRAMIAGLTAMLSIMEYDASLKRDPADVAIYTTRITALKNKIEYYKNLKPQ